MWKFQLRRGDIEPFSNPAGLSDHKFTSACRRREFSNFLDGDYWWTGSTKYPQEPPQYPKKEPPLPGDSIGLSGLGWWLCFLRFTQKKNTCGPIWEMYVTIDLETTDDEKFLPSDNFGAICRVEKVWGGGVGIRPIPQRVKKICERGRYDQFRSPLQKSIHGCMYTINTAVVNGKAVKAIGNTLDVSWIVRRLCVQLEGLAPHWDLEGNQDRFRKV